MTQELDLSKVTNIVFDDIDYMDYPDFCDAYISSADYEGKPMTGEMLDMVNEDYDFVYNRLMNHIF